MSIAACTDHGAGTAKLAAVDDQLAVEMNTTAELSVLDNDVGVADPFTLAIATAPMHGTATLGDDGMLHYQPATDYLGDDAVAYTVTGPKGATSTANVAIKVGCATCAIGVTITLSWNPNAAADMVTGYRMYFSTTNDPTTLMMMDDIAITRTGFDPTMPKVVYDAYSEFKLRIADNACFAMTAYNSAGESGYSNIACETVARKAMSFGLQ